MLSTIIITRNEEKNIEECIRSAKFSDQLIVIDNASEDNTVEIAKKLGAEVVSKSFPNFSLQREEGMRQAKNDWILYIDADERISVDLGNEIIATIKQKEAKEVYKIKRQNIFFDKYEWPKLEVLERLFRRDVLKGWYGDIHESPVFTGDLGDLNGFIDHYTHRDLTSMLNKTIKWSDIEADIRFKANHPRISWWRLLRVMITTFFDYYFKQKGFRMGTVGIIESVFQSYSIFITYTKLWELQNKN